MSEELIKLRPFKIKDALRLLRDLPVTFPDSKTTLRALEKGGPAFNLLSGKVVVACGGMLIRPSRVGNLWLILKPGTPILLIAGRIKAFIRDAVRTHSLESVQAIACESWPDYIAVLKLLGFTPAPSGNKRAALAGEALITLVMSDE